MSKRVLIDRKKSVYRQRKHLLKLRVANENSYGINKGLTMINNRTSPLNRIKKAALGILVVACLLTIYQILINPKNRTGFWGIGLPAQMANYEGEQSSFYISYPESWVITELPNGNHGDMDVIATILVPGRSWPQINIRRISLPEGDVEELATYGEYKISKEKKITQTTIDKFKTINIDGLVHDYSWQTSSLLFGAVSIRCKDYHTIQKSNGYTLSFCAEKGQWPEVENTFNQIIESFAVKEIP